MLADPRAEALSTRFAVAVAAAAGRRQDPSRRAAVSAYDQPRWPTSFKRETELLFDSIVREDRNVLDLLTADYTFVNERHRQGTTAFPNITGDELPARAADRRRTAAAFSATAAS